MDVSFSVPGRPVPQGSKRGVVTPGTGRVHMIESSKGLPDWRAQVSHEAALACPRGPTDAPVTMHATFVFSRPKSHYTASGELKPSAPTYPAKRSVGDLSKLVRAVEDSMSGITFADDSQVVSLIARKVFGWPERCLISCATGPAVLDYDESEAA